MSDDFFDDFEDEDKKTEKPVDETEKHESNAMDDIFAGAKKEENKIKKEEGLKSNSKGSSKNKSNGKSEEKKKEEYKLPRKVLVHGNELFTENDPKVPMEDLLKRIVDEFGFDEYDEPNAVMHYNSKNGVTTPHIPFQKKG